MEACALMYGKIFDSMYDGTLYGHWEAIVTFQQMIVLADADGIVDMTPQAMAARTSIPLAHIQAGLKILEEPDPYSRTPGNEGRRIELIDAHRPWGWHIINHEKYKRLRDADEVRAQNRDRQQRFRDKGSVTQRNAPSRDVTAGNAKSRHTDTDTDTDTEKRGGASRLPSTWEPSSSLTAWFSETRPDLRIAETVASFRDHWAAAAGANARKRDWDAAFRTWARRERPGSAKPPQAGEVI